MAIDTATPKAIDWVVGDKPLPLHVPMDLTGCAVKVYVQDVDSDAAAVELAADLSDTAAAAAGDFFADSGALELRRYRIKTVVTRGTELVATFPNTRTPQMLNMISGF